MINRYTESGMGVCFDIYLTKKILDFTNCNYFFFPEESFGCAADGKVKNLVFEVQETITD